GYRQCVEVGIGSTLTVQLGGKIDTEHGEPVEVTAIIEHVHRPLPTTRDVGVAVLRAGGVHIIVSELRKIFIRPDDFYTAGLNPLEHKLVVVNLGYPFQELKAMARLQRVTLSLDYDDMHLRWLPLHYVVPPI